MPTGDLGCYALQIMGMHQITMYYIVIHTIDATPFTHRQSSEMKRSEWV